MHRRLAAVTTIAALAVAGLSACVPLPPGVDVWPRQPVTYSDDFTPEDAFVEEVTEAWERLGPTEAEPETRADTLAAGWAWCDQIASEPMLRGTGFGDRWGAETSGWTVEQFAVLANAAEYHLCPDW
jgi:hypothetical protein